ncbi:MAG: type II toxin-antitoxin system RelE/ParE family toxin [Spirochaetes bacterium]|nr:type II toxin-antitoxin system RelE/ParE family toxin [Spirochaetota bacterium]
MMISFHPGAVEELNASVDYYENLAEGLGVEFADEVFSGIELISRYPEAWSDLSCGLRRCLISRFPFGLIYRKDNDEIYILAIMQMNREPDYWKSRR